MVFLKDLPPDGYRFIAYAESDGTAYVELPFGFDKMDEVKACAALGSLSSDKFLVAPKTWNNDNNRLALCGCNKNKFGVGFGGDITSKTAFNVQADENKYTWYYKDRVFSMNIASAEFDVTSIVWGTATAELRLFFGYNAATPGKIYYYKHKTASNGVTHYIRPIQNISTGVVEMYDLTTRTIMTRTGTLSAPTT